MFASDSARDLEASSGPFLMEGLIDEGGDFAGFDLAAASPEDVGVGDGDADGF